MKKMFFLISILFTTMFVYGQSKSFDSVEVKLKQLIEMKDGSARVKVRVNARRSVIHYRSLMNYVYQVRKINQLKKIEKVYFENPMNKVRAVFINGNLENCKWEQREKNERGDDYITKRKLVFMRGSIIKIEELKNTGSYIKFIYFNGI